MAGCYASTDPLCCGGRVGGFARQLSRRSELVGVSKSKEDVRDGVRGGVIEQMGIRPEEFGFDLRLVEDLGVE